MKYEVSIKQEGERVTLTKGNAHVFTLHGEDKNPNHTVLTGLTIMARRENLDRPWVTVEKRG